jgi:threonine synthase
VKQQLLINSDYFSNKFNCEFYFKPEWYGPTRAHKDKWAKVAIKLAKAAGARKVVALSSGNQGLALAVEASKQDIACAVCVEKSINPTYLDLFKKYSAQVLIGDSEEAQYKQFENLIDEGYFPLGVTHEQRVEGKQMPGIEAYKVTAKEIIDTLKVAPDIMVFPTAYADHPEGVLQGFIEQYETGLINSVPKFILVRANEHDGNEAPSIATDRTTPYITDVITRSNGEYVYVDNMDMRAAHDEIKKIQGWDVELASAASVAGLKKVSKEQFKDKRVVVMLTALADKTGI